VRDDSLHGDGVLDDSPVAGVTRLMARA